MSVQKTVQNVTHVSTVLYNAEDNSTGETDTY